jgi:hypothetical protein
MLAGMNICGGWNMGGKHLPEATVTGMPNASMACQHATTLHTVAFD